MEKERLAKDRMQPMADEEEYEGLVYVDHLVVGEKGANDEIRIDGRYVTRCRFYDTVWQRKSRRCVDAR